MYDELIQKLHATAGLTPEGEALALANLGHPPLPVAGTGDRALCGACVGIYLTGYAMPGETHECRTLRRLSPDRFVEPRHGCWRTECQEADECERGPRCYGPGVQERSS
jgi:hypothetical protein